MLEVQRMRAEAGYYYPPEPAETDWDIYYNEFELWLNSHYDDTTGTVFGYTWDDACESDDLLNEFIEERNRV
jgi:hypothetical protein